MPEPILYAHPFASYCQKVLTAFYEKGAASELRLLSPEDPAAGAELRALWPLERFPVLVADGRTLLESSIIIEWLDQRFPGATAPDPTSAGRRADRTDARPHLRQLYHDADADDRARPTPARGGA